MRAWRTRRGKETESRHASDGRTSGAKRAKNRTFLIALRFSLKSQHQDLEVKQNQSILMFASLFSLIDGCITRGTHTPLTHESEEQDDDGTKERIQVDAETDDVCAQIERRTTSERRRSWNERRIRTCAAGRRVDCTPDSTPASSQAVATITHSSLRSADQSLPLTS